MHTDGQVWYSGVPGQLRYFKKSDKKQYFAPHTGDGPTDK